MTAYLSVWLICAVCLRASSSLELSYSSARCDRTPKVLQARQGEIRSSSLYKWSLRQQNCTWLIPAEVGEPVLLSFTQFSLRCGLEWLSVASSSGEPVSLCGFQLPRPLEVWGGNVTVTYHFMPRLYSLSGFHLSYIRASGPCAPGEFECLHGRCLPGSWRCNGRSECLGEEGWAWVGSDEQDCAATSHIRTVATTSQRPPVTQGGSLRPIGANQPCGGILLDFYGWFAPPQPSGEAIQCVWTVDPQDPRPVRLTLQQLELGPADSIMITDRPQGRGNILRNITCVSNYKVVEVESRTGLFSLTYHTLPDSEGRGFNATYHTADYCPPWDGVCGGLGGGCFTAAQRCDGHWDCRGGDGDEAGCWGCPPGQFACGGVSALKPGGPGHPITRPVCYPPQERCNYQLYCADGSDERDCTVCRPGTFHCDADRCVFDSWRCDGQMDCKDGTDELNCPVILPRKVITAATVGSLVCGLLLVIAMGCTCKLYSLRSREYSLFAPITRQEAELIQQQAPPSYGQLIAQGVIPPVEDFPTENPNEATSLTLRSILQLLRQEPGSSPRRRRRPRFVRRAIRRMRRWGLIPRSPPRPAQTTGTEPQPSETSPSGSDTSLPHPGTSSVEGGIVPHTLPHKSGLVTQGEQLAPPTLVSRSETPPPTTPEPGPPPGSPSLAALFHSLGLSIALFRPSVTPASPLSSSPSSSDDEVLLIPLSEDTAPDDDVAMLT